MSEIGDVIDFKTVPIFNLQSLTTWSISATGITATRLLSYSFSYSLDGIVFSQNYPFTSIADMISEINPKLTNETPLTIIFSCERVGTDTTGDIEINSILFNGIYLPYQPNFENQLKSIFQKIGYDDINVWNNMVSLSKKIYDEGIVPIYVERNEIPNDLYEDKDFVAYWTSIAQFFSLSYIFSIQFTIIWWRYDLLAEYLRQRNVIFCERADIIELQKIAKSIFNEFRERGTKEIYVPKDYEYPLGYRSRYVLPDDFALQPTNPIWIDGVKYTEASNLPYGWNIMCHEEVQLSGAPGTEEDIKITFNYQGGTVDFIMNNIPTGWHYSSPLARLTKPCNDGYVAIVAEYMPGPYALTVTLNHFIYLFAPDVNYYEVQVVNYLVAPVIDENYIDIVDTLDRVNLSLATASEPTHFTEIKKQYNGEYLRLICFHNKCDWFAYLLMNKEKRGWNINNSSPLYKGLRNQQNGTFINGYENFSEEVWDLLYYPIIGDAIVPPPPIETFLILTGDGDLLNANQPDPQTTHVPY